MVEKGYSRCLAEEYDRRHFGGKSGYHILKQDCEAVSALLLPAPGLILDIPCGTRAYTAQLAGLGYDVVAADVSAPMLRITGARGTGAAGHLCSIHGLPFANDAFHGTVTLRLFSHFSQGQTAQALGELRRVVKPGGRVIFDSFRWTPRRWAALRRLMAQDTIHEMAPADVERLIADSGLRVTGRETRYLFSPIWQRKLPYCLLRALTAAEAHLPDRWLLRTFWACTKDT